MSSMKGLVTYPDGEIKLTEVPVPRIGDNIFAPRDVLCEVEYCGICGSDIHKWLAEDKGDIKYPPNSVVSGHEIVSVVKEVGSGVTRFKPGDRVVHEIVTFYCGECPACLEGRYNICNTIPPMQGRAHFMTGGGFARYVVWPEQQLHRLPDSVGSREGCTDGTHRRQYSQRYYPHGHQGRGIRCHPGTGSQRTSDDAGL